MWLGLYLLSTFIEFTLCMNAGFQRGAKLKFSGLWQVITTPLVILSLSLMTFPPTSPPLLVESCMLLLVYLWWNNKFNFFFLICHSLNLFAVVYFKTNLFDYIYVLNLCMYLHLIPSQWTQLQFGLFSVPTSGLQLVYQRPWYVLFCLWKSAYKRSLAAYRKE